MDKALSKKIDSLMGQLNQQISKLSLLESFFTNINEDVTLNIDVIDGLGATLGEINRTLMDVREAGQDELRAAGVWD